MKMRPELRDRALARAAEVLEPVAKSSRVLESIAWPRSVERAFFAAGATKLPEPVYSLDRAGAEENIAALSALAEELAGEHPMLAWLRALVGSYIDANRMIVAVGTREFYTLAHGIYGGARTTALDSDTTNLDFAEHVSKRLGPPGDADEGARPVDTAGFVHEIERRLARRHPPLPMEIVRDADLSAKVICGMTRLRVREGATFALAEAESLYVHEI